MATRRKLEIKEPLETMVVNYYEKKNQMDSLKKVVDDYNKRIKDEMQAMNIDSFDAGGLVATISVTPKEDFNEEQAIEILRKNLPANKFKQIVKTREYIDNDALEKAIYNKQLDAAILSPCITPKEPVVTLRVKAKK